MSVERPGYRLELARNGLAAVLSSPAGEHWLTLSLLAAFDTVDAVDETLAVEAHWDGDRLLVERRSTLWQRAGLVVECGDDAVVVRSWVEGAGALGGVHLLGGRSMLPGPGTGFHPTGSSFRTLFSPNPGHPGRLVRSAAESAVLGVSGDGALGRGHWFFTPAPLCLGLTTASEVAVPEEPLAAGWLMLGVAAPVEELDVVQVEYRPADRAFHLVLDHEGHRRVDGRFEAPALVLAPGAPDPYTGLRRHRDDLAGRGCAPPVRTRPAPEWWTEPIFCGWGAQCHLAIAEGGRAPDYATQANYDAFLAALERRQIVPGTVVIDDKWQVDYGTNSPDTAKWPDLGGWIADRHERGQRVLLWWKAWDAEGLPEELCIRDPDGTPVALDPTNPRAREALRASIHSLLAPDGLDADGLKIDFTARTPSGRALSADGPGWGIALLHDLLSVVYEEAKQSKPDALVITHTPHPGFVDVTDMVRLNDALRLDDPGPRPDLVPQMEYRARVAAAACPELLIDTDDWCIPDRATWRAFLERKPQLGVPSLYYATHIDLSGEPLEAEDYEALRSVWARWREVREAAPWGLAG